MGMYDLDDLLRKWVNSEITPEMAIGQLLQFTEAHRKRMNEQDERIRELSQRLKGAAVSLTGMPSTTGKKPTAKK